MGTNHLGEAEAFDKNWNIAPEAQYLHWTRGRPQNQIQFAFRQHWETFKNILGKQPIGRDVLEVGCGRGSLSAYFSDAGWNCKLLDKSDKAIQLARKAFAESGLNASFDVGDCLNLPYDDRSFDVVFSIGLLEHFDEIHRVLFEQFRVLRDGGTFFGYVVPEMPNNLQKDYRWINDILATIINSGTSHQKTEVFRSDLMSDRYIPVMKKIGFKNIVSTGIYSVPMISYSPEFPFTLLPPKAEQRIVKHFTDILEKSKLRNNGKNPWLCEEGYGQAFLLVAIK